ncbi:MAG: ATP-binding protein [Candidatus Kapabacteria bacterium]|nr:ATP-binding protein [Candidatus Kapabacteria bacterium]
MIRRSIYIDKMKLYLEKPIIKVLTGMRRVGKSTILNMFSHEICENDKEYVPLMINMESLEFSFIRDYNDLNLYVKEKFNGIKSKKILFIDEIQEIQNWEKAISSFLSNGIADIYITGSNANLLSSELATLISGRYIEIPVFPLTFKEFNQFIENKNKDLDDNFVGFLRYGGLPGIHLFPLEDEPVFNYLNGIFNTVILKDVLIRNKIRDAAVLEKIVIYLFDNIGNITTSKSIANYFKSHRININTETVQNYLNYLQSAFLLYKVPRYDIKGKKYLEFYDKVFIGDIGLRHGLLGYKEDDISGLLENIVYLEFLSQGYKVTIGAINGLEIDFIAEKQNEIIYLQVCKNLSEESTIEREFGNLEKISNNHKKIVLSLEKFFPSNKNGIKHYYLPKFLMENS